MFHLTTKDGENVWSNGNNLEEDIAEFSKLLKEKLGEEVSDMFEELIESVQEEEY